MIDRTPMAKALTGRANLASTCPPPFGAVGTVHRFNTSATLHLNNESTAPVPLDITLTIERPGKEIADHKETHEAAPGQSLHTINWVYEHSLMAADSTILVKLRAVRQDDQQAVIASSWQVCEFTVE